jgi:hypothetical protein
VRKVASTFPHTEYEDVKGPAVRVIRSQLLGMRDDLVTRVRTMEVGGARGAFFNFCVVLLFTPFLCRALPIDADVYVPCVDRRPSDVLFPKF